MFDLFISPCESDFHSCALRLMCFSPPHSHPFLHPCSILFSWVSSRPKSIKRSEKTDNTYWYRKEVCPTQIDRLNRRFGYFARLRVPHCTIVRLYTAIKASYYNTKLFTMYCSREETRKLWRFVFYEIDVVRARARSRIVYAQQTPSP